MKYYKSKRNTILFLDIIAIVVSFTLALVIRYRLLIANLGSSLVINTYVRYFAYALIIYILFFLIKSKPRIEKQSYKEIIIMTIEHQVVFIAIYLVFFFLYKQELNISRVVVCLFFLGNIVLCSIFRIIYHNYCVKKDNVNEFNDDATLKNDEQIERLKTDKIKHCYIIGSKSLGQYGGFESFVINLLQNHKNNKAIKYHVACKANGQGFMNLEELPGATRINDEEFAYCNSHCFLVKVPEKLGSAQAIYYDLRALKWACEHIERNHITEPVVYILASRVGCFEKKYVRRIHDAGGQVYQNPDGHEDKRKKWNLLIRKYWKISEQYAVKNADLVICDSRKIRKYIIEEYSRYNPKTTFIPYGACTTPSELDDDNEKYQNWLTEHNLTGDYYLSVGRFVEENNYEVMIREFMLSKTKKDFAIITTYNPKYVSQLQQKLQFKKDKRIKFVGTVYDSELLKKIRENAHGYLHGHEVGGTNPSLLESLSSTKLNLLYDVKFNREVAKDSALYWNKEEGNLARIIDDADRWNKEKIEKMGKKAKQRIMEEYTWNEICSKYMKIFLNQ